MLTLLAQLNRLHTCGSIMAEKLDPKEIVTPDELAISTMWENSVLVEVLIRKGNYEERFSSNGCEVRPSCTQYQTALLSRVQDNITIAKEESHGFEDLCRWLAVFGDRLAVE